MKALFLDRDGTLVVDKGYVHNPKEVELLRGVGEALKRALAADYSLFMLTNQSGVGRGYYSLEDVYACNRYMERLLKLPKPLFLEVGVAPEVPDGPTLYRKPSPRFILEMIAKYGLDPKHCFMLGDRLSDIEAGMNAGIKGVGLATDPKIGLREKVKGLRGKESPPIFGDLPEFINALLNGDEVLK